jgi:hypothetical protein
MRRPTTKDDSLLDQILHHPHALNAFEKLVKAGADSKSLETKLTLGVIFWDTAKRRKPRRWLPRRRVLKSVITKIAALEGQIADLDGYWGILAKTSSLKLRVDGRERLLSTRELQEMLHEYRSNLELISFKEPPKGEAGHQSSARQLVNYIKETTGKCHYPEISVLLDSVEAVINGVYEPRSDPVAVKQVIYRENKRSTTNKKLR